MTDALRVGIAGLGTVGAGVVKILQNNTGAIAARAGRPIEVVAVNARDKAKDRGVDLSAYHWCDDPADVAQAEVDVVCELMGGSGDPAKGLCEVALARGKHVVTANKALVAEHGGALMVKAQEGGASLKFEAAVAGGIPVIKGLSEGLAANRISRVYGILNGTGNYILTAMEETGRAFEDVLAEAQALGYAEADPSFDVDSIDAGQKLSLLASICFGTELAFDKVFMEGMREIAPLDLEFAAELGYRIKVLGIASMSEAGLEQRVHPSMVPLKNSIAHVNGVLNAVVAEGDFIGRIMMEGPGAGEGPTASAVVADLVDIARGQLSCALPGSVAVNSGHADVQARTGAYYVRFTVIDRPGVMADITAVLREEDVSVESLIQRGRAPGEPVSVVMTTHEAIESAVQRVVESVAARDYALQRPVVIRIEDL